MLKRKKTFFMRHEKSRVTLNYLLTLLCHWSLSEQPETIRTPGVIIMRMGVETTLQIHHVYSTLKLHGNNHFHVFPMRNARGVFVGQT